MAGSSALRSPTTKSPRHAPQHHHRRHNSASGIRHVRESLHAMSVKLNDGSRQINQYHILKCLGRGMFATVHLGEFVDEDGQHQYVAIKEFDKRRLCRKRHMDMRVQMRGNLRAMNDKDPLYLVRTEVAILKKLCHPHVVRLYEALDDPDEDKLFLVFENCPGGPLYHIEPGKQSECIPEDKARIYFRQILSGLDYMHANGIVHRDIKPENILLVDDNQCKITDFGVSEMVLEPGDDRVKRSVGTPAFMSPELCRMDSKQSSHGCPDDVWALGVTLYTIVIGHLPFDRENLLDLYDAIQHDQPDLKGAPSAECRDLLLHMLDKSESTRITVKEIYNHPWVTQHGKEPMPLPAATVHANSELPEVTEEDLCCAVFRISSMFTVARAVSKFKRAGSRRDSRSTSASDDCDDLGQNPPKTRPKSVPGFGSSDIDNWDAIYEQSASFPTKSRQVQSPVQEIPMAMSPTTTMDRATTEPFCESLPQDDASPGIPLSASPDNASDPVICVSSPTEIDKIVSPFST